MMNIENISPELATVYLGNNHSNRKLRSYAVSAYAKDMLAGKWKLSPVPICFLPGGSLGNGQHRLAAVAKTGLSQLFYVARDVPADVIGAMDVGRTRSINDISSLRGDNFDTKRGRIARVVEYGMPQAGSDRVQTYEDMLALYKKHQEVVDFVYEQQKGNDVQGLGPTVLGAIARAAYTQDRERLSSFIFVVRTGQAQGPQDWGATTFKRWASSGNVIKQRFKGITAAQETYCRVQAALLYFLRNEPMTKLYGVKNEQFPVPQA